VGELPGAEVLVSAG